MLLWCIQNTGLSKYRQIVGQQEKNWLLLVQLCGVEIKTGEFSYKSDLRDEFYIKCTVYIYVKETD